MGFNGLLRFVKPFIELVNIKKYAGKRVGIDAYSWLHKGESSENHSSNGTSINSAPYETDAPLAYLDTLEVEKGGVVVVITEGSMCVFAGCEFLPSVPGIGIVKAHSFVTKYQNLGCVLLVLKIEKGSQMPEDYPKSFKEAVAVFQHARMFEQIKNDDKHSSIKSVVLFLRYHKSRTDLKCWSIRILEVLNVTDCASLQQMFQLQVEPYMAQILSNLRALNLLAVHHMFVPRRAHHKMACVERLKIYGCYYTKAFEHGERQLQEPLFHIRKIIPQLEEVAFSSDDIAMISNGEFAADFFRVIKVVWITHYLDETVAFPFRFLQIFYNLQILEMFSCNFKELSFDEGGNMEVTSTFPTIKELKLDFFDKIQYQWNQDSPLNHMCGNLECLRVWRYESMIDISSVPLSTFQYLATLNVWNCNAMAHMITSSKARCFGAARYAEDKRL
ncbi:Alpha dioxygenase, DOX2 [Hibiscus syriacus]|uniref:Exonuclease 1 n=1 Tax=Hibiscus syriacus TaxID=106335 RepID=A0A6A2YDF7_HIBSY|nr:Alpha dioxygenase, DOX2 [Hibiscus syriacus]